MSIVTIAPTALRTRDSVLAQLAWDSQVDASAIGVTAQDGAVTLTGFIRSPCPAQARAVTNLYRECLYLFLQKLIYRGQNVYPGTITNPVGCAVAYRLFI